MTRRIFDIMIKDLSQLLRERNTFLFLLIMPVAFTLMLGFAFGGFGSGDSDSRLPVGLLDQDGHPLGKKLHDLLANSEVIRLVENPFLNAADLEIQVMDEDLAGAIIIPSGYGKTMLHGKAARLVLFAETSTPVGTTVQNAALTASMHLDNAVRTAIILERLTPEHAQFDYAVDEALEAWEDPPIKITETTSSAIDQEELGVQAFTHTSPGMMLQFAIAGLMTAAQILVNERKTRSLQRMLTTATLPYQILVGHYLAIVILIFGQFVLLISFGQLILRVNYVRSPVAILAVVLCAALCIGAVGLLIGTLAKNEDQAVTFSLIPMFLFAGLGGAWMPLEATGPVFQTIGHVSPIAWAMDGIKNITVRGLGLESVIIPSLALLGYAALFFGLAVWRFRAINEKL